MDFDYNDSYVIPVRRKSFNEDCITESKLFLNIT